MPTSRAYVVIGSSSGPAGVVDDAQQRVHRVGERRRQVDPLDPQPVVARRERRQLAGVHLVGVAGEDDVAGRPAGGDVDHGCPQRQAGRVRKRPHREGLTDGEQLVGLDGDAPPAAEADRWSGGQDAEELGLHGLGDLQGAVHLRRVHRLVRRRDVVGLDAASPTRAARCRRRPCRRRRTTAASRGGHRPGDPTASCPG